ncbi:hypothetical protein RhiirB3_433268 [Rhizophagus irregularis]|nr:hypothetical protein RhiirB3_433268 [Rhizophagus irregularis]
MHRHLSSSQYDGMMLDLLIFEKNLFCIAYIMFHWKYGKEYEEDYLNRHVACSGCKADEDREQFDTTNKRAN